jgi:hypothetical protein
LLSTGLLAQKAAASTALALSWKASPSSPNIDGYRVYYGTSSGNYSQHIDFAGTGTSGTVASAPAGSTFYYTVVAYKDPRTTTPNAHSNSDPGPDAFSDSKAYTDTYPHTTTPNAHANNITDHYARSFTDTKADTYADSYRNAIADRNTSSLAHADTDANANS